MKFQISNMLFNLRKVAVALTLVTALGGCVKEKFDTPPVGGEDPVGIVANTTIKSLKSRYTIGASTPVKVTDDLIISGIVNADDKDGNFYKVITLQDSTGGIQIKIDNSSLSGDFPVGRRIFVKCKDLFLGEYSGLVQLGGYIDNSDGYPQLGYVSSTVAQEKILKGKWGITVTPIPVSIATLDNITYQNMLVQFDDVQFACADVFQTYADVKNLGSLNRTIEDCSGNTIIARTSGFARFGGEKTPGGKLKVLGIFTVYKSGSTWTKQLALRNTNDVVQTGTTRCDGTTIGSSADISISTIRGLYAGSDVDAPCARVVKGVVVADNAQSNFDTRTIFVQDATGGIAVYVGSVHNFAVGDSVEVSTSGATITEFKGLLELKTSISYVTKISSTTAKARKLTVAQILASFENYESTLVTIDNATLSGNGGIYGGNVTLTDGTSGSLTLYTKTGTTPATFATSTYPTPGPSSVTGVLQQFNSTYQISIRTTADIQ